MSKQIALSQDDYDLVWEILMETGNCLRRGSLNAHQGIFGQGGVLEDITAEMAEKIRDITVIMSKYVATDQPSITLTIKE